MAGSLRQLPSGAWQLRVYLGRNETGKVVLKSKTVRGTRREAQAELNQLVAQYQGRLTEVSTESARAEGRILRWGPNTTINDAIEGWKLNGWSDLSPTTQRRYQGMWDLQVRNGIGRRRLADLTPWDLERFFRELKSQGLSKDSVRQVRAMLHRACRLARKWSNGALPNPVADTELPEWSYAEQSPEVRSPTAEEVRAVLAAAEQIDRRLAVFFRVAAATGARRGELCALRWSDVDWDTSTVRFDEAVIAAWGPSEIKAPKTRKSVRRVAVDAGTLDRLRKYKAVKEAEAALCGAQVADDGFVFSVHPAGTVAPHPDPFTLGFRKSANTAGVAADVHLHSLRHFQSTELDSVISEAQKQARIGRTTIQMARRYTDFVSEEDKRAASHVGTILDPLVRLRNKHYDQS